MMSVSKEKAFPPSVSWTKRPLLDELFFIHSHVTSKGLCSDLTQSWLQSRNVGLSLTQVHSVHRPLLLTTWHCSALPQWSTTVRLGTTVVIRSVWACWMVITVSVMKDTGCLRTARPARVSSNTWTRPRSGSGAETGYHAVVSGK